MERFDLIVIGGGVGGVPSKHLLKVGEVKYRAEHPNSD